MFVLNFSWLNFWAVFDISELDQDILKSLEAKYIISGEINTRISADAKSKMQEIASVYNDGKIEWLDGVSVTYSDWHFNVRASNTEPLLRLNLEAKTRSMMEGKRDELLDIIRR